LLGLTLNELEDLCYSIGEKTFRGRQLYKWIYQKRVFDFAQMTDLSKDLRTRLEKISEIIPPVTETIEHSADGFTRKFRYLLRDGTRIESVLMKDGKRVTLCLSTQIGCALGCKFCATGAIGFKRNLDPGEIVGQYLVASKDSEERISNLVLMGMGEPLLNYDNVAKALRIFTDGDGIALSARRITLSTAGIIPGVKQMTQDKLPCKLAVSLNAPDNDLRRKLMPIAQKYPLKQLFPVLHQYEKSTRHRVTFEYVLLGGINDLTQHAYKLRKLLGGFTAKLNLIEFNSFPLIEKSQIDKETSHFKSSSQKNAEKFADIVSRPGLTVMMRKSRGGDISAACGQLCLAKKS
jgi:23S rRNA (adenine2503-C2)-methyltransferase